MIRFAPKIRPVVLLILLVLICEAIGIYVLIRQGWFGNGDRFRLASLVILFAIPIAIMIGCISRGTTRFSIWQMLVGFTILSLWFTWLAKPILEFRSSRTGSLLLTQAGCSLTSSSTDTNLTHRKMSPWMDLFLHDCSNLPSDNRVSCIVVHDDQQLQLLIDNAERFPSLRSITLFRVSQESMRRLGDVLSEFDQLIDVWSHSVVFPPDWFRRLPQLQSIGISCRSPSDIAPIDLSDLVDIAAMPDLIRFSAAGIGIDDEQAEALGSSRFLKEIVLRRTQISPLGEQLLKKGLSSRRVVVMESINENVNGK